MTTFLLVLALIVAIAAGSIRIGVIAGLALLCLLFPAVLILLIPAIGYGIYHLLRRA